MPVLNIDGNKTPIEVAKETNGIHYVKVGDETVRVEILEESQEDRLLVLRTRDKVNTIMVRDSTDGVWSPIWLNGRLLMARIEREELVIRGREGAAVEEAPVLVSSPMAGKIVALKAAIGSKVKEGQALVVLEAMKMENEIAAPRAGQVKEVFVRQGALVKPGDKLVLVD